MYPCTSLTFGKRRITRTLIKFFLLNCALVAATKSLEFTIGAIHVHIGAKVSPEPLLSFVHRTTCHKDLRIYLEWSHCLFIAFSLLYKTVKSRTIPWHCRLSPFFFFFFFFF